MKKWTQKDTTYLMQSYGKKNIETISKKLDRSFHAIRIKAKRLGLIYQINFSLDEDKYLIKYYGKKSILEFSKKLNRTKGSIKGRLVRIRKKTELRLLPLESPYKKLINGRTKDCLVCGLEFRRPPRHYSDKAWYNKKYCSTKCAGKDKQKIIIKKCIVCGISFKTLPLANRKYCSYGCYYKNLLGKRVWNKGIKSSEETKRKLSESHKGHVPSNKGKTWEWMYGEEKAQKIRNSRKKIPI